MVGMVQSKSSNNLSNFNDMPSLKNKVQVKGESEAMAGLAHQEITTLPVPLKKKLILKPKAKVVEAA